MKEDNPEQRRVDPPARPALVMVGRCPEIGTVFGRNAFFPTQRSDASRSFISEAIVVSSACASCRTTPIDGIRWPRSKREMYVRCRPALAARASWDRPTRCRRRRTTLPNCCSNVATVDRGTGKEGTAPEPPASVHRHMSVRQLSSSRFCRKLKDHDTTRPVLRRGRRRSTVLRKDQPWPFWSNQTSSG
jgi:hypothetical protein